MSDPSNQPNPKRNQVKPLNNDTLQESSNKFDESQRKRGYYTRGYRPPTPGPRANEVGYEPGASTSGLPPISLKGRNEKPKPKPNKVEPWIERNKESMQSNFQKFEALKRRNMDTPVLPPPIPPMQYNEVGNEQTAYTSISRQGILPPARTLQEVNDTWLHYRSLTSTPREAPQRLSAREAREAPNYLPEALALAIDRRFVRMMVKREKVMDRYHEEMKDYREYREGSPDDQINQVRDGYRRNRHSYPYDDSTRWGRLFMDITETQSHSGHSSVFNSIDSQDSIGQEVTLEHDPSRRSSSVVPRHDLAPEDLEAEQSVEPEEPVIIEQPVGQGQQNQDNAQRAANQGGSQQPWICCFKNHP